MAIPRAWSTPTTPGSGQLALSMHPSVNDRWQMERPPPRHKAPAFWRRRGGNHVGRMKGPQRQSRPGPRCPTDAAGDRGRACRVTGHHPPPFRGSLRPPGVWGATPTRILAMVRTIRSGVYHEATADPILSSHQRPISSCTYRLKLQGLDQPHLPEARRSSGAHRDRPTRRQMGGPDIPGWV
jgi:hypothetical protein